MSENSSDNESYIIPEVDNLITQIGNLDLQDNFINIKPIGIKTENPNITDIPSTSTEPNIRFRQNQSFNKPVTGYAGLMYAGTNSEKYTPYEKMKADTINPFGIYLDLDCIANIEEAIDKWETALRIAVVVNKMDFETVKGFMEKTLLNSAQRFWQNINEDTKQALYSDPDNFITKVVETFRLEFHGEGKYVKDPNTITRYTTALMRLQLCDICDIERYICVFQDYYYHIYNQVTDTSNYLPLFFAKIPDPWGTKLIETYNPGNVDTLGKRIEHVRDKFSNWCADAILAKATKGLRKRVSLCCDKPKMPLMIGCDSSYYYGKIKRKYKKKKQYKYRKPYFKRRKARYYKKKGYKKTYKPMYKKRKTNPKECRCYYCKQIGHYANNCPKRNEKNKKKIEIDSDIEDMINTGEFIRINDFNIDSDESIFIITDTEYTSEEETE